MTGPQSADPSARADELRRLVEYHNHRYHALDDPEIPDADYDALAAELRTIEAAHPELLGTASPSQAVGATPSVLFAPVHHQVPMMSLDNAFSFDDLMAWAKRMERVISGEVRLACELKIDGVAISLVYEGGNLIRAATRGNGEVGEDVTANVSTVAAIPERLDLPIDQMPSRLEVRGELYMPLSAFQALNRHRAEAGLRLFANPRNSAAGSLRQKEPAVTATRELAYWAHQLVQAEGAPAPWRHSEGLALLERAGLPVNPELSVVANLEEVHDYCRHWEAHRHDLGYEIDGVVVKIDDLAQRRELGATSRVPRWAMAFKFPPEERATRLRNIMVSIGKSGKATPFAQLEPVVVGGSTVGLASLHNQDQVALKDVRPGDTVLVRKAGDVIPEVLGPVLSARPEGLAEWTFPANCPVCGGPLVRLPGESDTFCTNLDCPGQRLQRIVHFASRGAMDIEGLGEARVALFLQHKLLADAGDTYTIRAEDLARLDGFGQQSVANLLNAIDASRRRPLANLLVGLSIRHLGDTGALALARALGHLDRIQGSSAEDLARVEGVGPKIATSVAEFFASPRNQLVLDKLRQAGVNLEGPAAPGLAQTLEGCSVVVTGTLEGWSREDAEAAVKARGGKSPGTVSKKTTAVVTGRDPGAAKLAAATELGVPVIDEDGFAALLDTGRLLVA